MNYEKAYTELKAFCETLYERVYCDNCGVGQFDENPDDCTDCEDCHRKVMGWCFPKSTIDKIEKENE